MQQNELQALNETGAQSPVKYQSDTLGARIMVGALWSAITFLALACVIGSNGKWVAPTFFLLLVQVPFILRVWTVTVYADTIVLHRLIGPQIIKWSAIQEVAYSPLTNFVSEITANGKRVRMLWGPQIAELTSLIKSETQKNARPCHSDFHTHRFIVLTETSSVGERSQTFLTGVVGFILFGSVFGQKWLWGLGIIIALLLIPFWAVVNVFGNRNRASHVRVSDHGLSVRTLLGERHIAWNSVIAVERKSSLSYIELKTNNDSVKLGTELTNFTNLVERINQNTATNTAIPRTQNGAQNGN